MWRCVSGLLLLAVVAGGQTPATADAAQRLAVTGQVRDGRGGEPLAKVTLELFRQRRGGAPNGSGAEQPLQVQTTGADGRFRFDGLRPGGYLLRARSVDFRPVEQEVQFPPQIPQQGLEQSVAPELVEVAVLLMPQWLRQKVDVAADPLAVAGSGAATANALELSGRELQNLSSLLIADPLRSVQTLPAVASNDDFRSQFSVHGAPFGRTGMVVDGVLLHAPFHAVGSDPNSASATAFPGEILEGLTLHPGPPPVEFGDRSAAVLDARTREGDATGAHARLLLSASNASAQVEGPMGAGGRGTWLVSARKSYLQYIIERTAPDNTLAFAFADVQAKFGWQLARQHRLQMTWMAGESGLDRTQANRNFGPNTLVESEDRSFLATVALLSSGARWTATQRVAWLNEATHSWNRERRELARDGYGEWVGSSWQSWQWREGASLDFGGTVRRQREDGFFQQALALPATFLRVDRFRGRALRSGAYGRQNWSGAGGRVQASAGMRVDHSQLNGQVAAAPQAAVAWQATGSTRVSWQWGQAVQYPEIVQARSEFTRQELPAARATHYAATVEQRFGLRTRLRVEGYARLDRDLAALPGLETRLVRTLPVVGGGVTSGVAVVAPNPTAGWVASQRGRARFLTVSFQRRTANGLEGWLAYTYGKATTSDGVLGQTFASDFDQRHALNLFGSYRLRPSVNLSGRYTYGSGFPVPGYFRGALGATFLATGRNELRFPAYQRWDVRCNKSFRAAGLHWTLFVEAINLTNRRNLRFSDYGGFNSRTNQATVRTTTMLPLLPTAGLAVAF